MIKKKCCLCLVCLFCFYDVTESVSWAQVYLNRSVYSHDLLEDPCSHIYWRYTPRLLARKKLQNW